MIAEIEQRIHIRIHLEYDITTTAAVTACRTALRYKFLAAESRLAVTTVTSLDDHLGSIDKLHCYLHSGVRYPS